MIVSFAVRDDVLAVQLELDRHCQSLIAVIRLGSDESRVIALAHRSIFVRGKYFITQRIGFGAACPRPQIEASAIATDSSSSSGRSHCGCAMRPTAFAVPDAARRALAARLFGEELHDVARGARRCVLVGQDDHRSRADEAAVRLQRVEIEGNVAQARGQDAARRAAGQIAVELMPRQHAAAVLVDQLLHGDARRREVHAGLVDAARHRERAQPFAAVAAVRCEPLRALLDDLAHPVQRFHVVLERRPAEEAHLRDIRRAQPRHAALAFDRFDHRRLFAADVRTGAAPQIDRRQRARRILRERGAARARESRGIPRIRRADRCRPRKSARPTRRSACLRGNDADRARGNSGP